jgi:hypothetical protein
MLRKPTRPARILIALAMGGYGIWWLFLNRAKGQSDLDQVWYAATALRHGLNPYDVIGPRGTWFHWYWPFYYPMPAVLLAVPLSFLPLTVARYAFVGASSGLLAYGVTRRAWFPLMLFASGPYVHATLIAQWSPLFTAAVLLPGLAVIFPAKPTLGAICAAPISTSRRTAIGVLLCWIVLAVLSWVALPQWFASWRVAIRGAAHVRPLIMLPGGFLLLAAAVKWRRPEARLLMAYALVPHTTMLYEAVPALLVPDTWPQMLMLTIGSIVAYGIESTMIHANDVPTLIARQGMVTILWVYLPALALVLRRSNEGAAPRWLEETIDHASASVWRLARKVHVPATSPSTVKRLTVIALAAGMAAAIAAWFYYGLTG